MHQSDNPTALFETARAAHRQNHLADAERLYRAALACASNHADAQEWLGMLCLQTGRRDEAIALLTAAAEGAPRNATYQDNLAAVLIQAARPQGAVAPLRRALALRPDDIPSLVRLAGVQGTLGRYNEATQLLERAVRLDPVLRARCRDTDQIHSEEERSRTILENCRLIQSRYPAFAPAHYAIACEMEKLGRFDEACRAAEQAIACNPTLPGYYHVLVQGGNPVQKKAARQTLEQLAAQQDFLPQDSRYALHFHLAKLYEGEDRFEDAFAHMKTANALKRETITYDEVCELNRMRIISKIYCTLPSCVSPTAHAKAAVRPLFVVGMPRSGTTLIEQILASHPAVCGAGELQTLTDLERDIGADDPARGQPSTAAVAALGTRYLDTIAQIAPDAAYVVDKYPLNFLRLGLIHMALPQARIVHIMRDPLDTCLSCFEQLFAGPLDFTYDLGELGRYYRAYETLMAHWRTVLPEDVLLEVSYEALVNDLEGQARRLTAFCGLEWDARCLQFHKTQRAVVTASFAQVRQPIYRKSVGRAQNYAPWLEPLRQALNADAPPHAT